MSPIQQVFNAYAHYRKLVGKPLQSKVPTDPQSRKINAAIKQVGANDLVLMFEYFAKSDDEYVQFMNGNNDNGRFYGMLDNMFRTTLLQEKINRARSWKQRTERAAKNAAKDMFVPFQLVEQDEYQQHLAKEFEDLQYEEPEPPKQQIGAQQTLFANFMANQTNGDQK